MRRAIPVFGHREMLHQWEPAGAEALQGRDAVVAQVQLSEEDLVVQPGRLADRARGQRGASSIAVSCCSPAVLHSAALTLGCVRVPLMEKP